ncbi:MAG: hypothetical protein HY904_00630 [Deltaproteobacteria bacterium]|nr:hypothetical protein [Deltaproteobacteria bacterium]
MAVLIRRGQVVCYRTYDAAEEFDLARAATALMEQVVTRASFRRVKPAHLQVADPPLQVRMGTTTVRAGSITLGGDVVVRVFATGVASVGLWLDLPADTPLEDLKEIVAGLQDNTAVDDLASSMVQRLVRTLGRAAHQPRPGLGVVEDYVVVLARELGPGSTPADLRQDPALAAVLLGEPPDAPDLSTERVRQMMARALSYYDDDLVLIEWSAAFVLDPRGGEDVADILEFTTQQLVEFRFYDAFLDEELGRVYDEVEQRARRRLWSLLAGRLNALATDLMLLRVELTEVTEKIDNSLKLAGEPFLARVYLVAVERFRITHWRVSVEEKIKLVDEMVTLVRGEVHSGRSLSLEMAVVLLILVEIVMGLLRH